MAEADLASATTISCPWCNRLEAALRVVNGSARLHGASVLWWCCAEKVTEQMVVQETGGTRGLVEGLVIESKRREMLQRGHTHMREMMKVAATGWPRIAKVMQLDSGESCCCCLGATCKGAQHETQGCGDGWKRQTEQNQRVMQNLRGLLTDQTRHYAPGWQQGYALQTEQGDDVGGAVLISISLRSYNHY